MKIQHATYKVGLSIVATTLMALPANSADEVDNGFARAFSCGKAGINIEKIHALEGKGVAGGDVFITASVTAPLAQGAAGFVWTPKPGPLSGQDLVRLELYFEGDPKLTDLLVCYELKGKNNPRRRASFKVTHSVFLKHSSKLSEPDAHGFRTVSWDAGYFELIMHGPLNDALIHSIHVVANEPSVYRGPGQHNSVTFGRIALVYKDRTIVPRVLSTPERGDAGCRLEEECIRD